MQAQNGSMQKFMSIECSGLQVVDSNGKEINDKLSI